MRSLPSNGYGLDDTLYEKLVDRMYGFEEYYYYKRDRYYKDYIFILNELDNINRKKSIDESYKNAILGWFISFKNLPRRISTQCIIFKITDACQLQCKHCYQQYTNKSNKFMSYDEFVFLFYKHLRVADKFVNKDLNNREVVFEGGEATLNKDLSKMIKFLNSKNIRILLLTNGLFIPDDVISSLKEDSRNRVQISIDGFKETHDFIRGNGTFDKSMSTIKLLRDNNINVYCNFVAHKQNYHEFLKLKQYLFKKNIVLRCIHYTSQNNEIESLNKDQLTEIIPYYSENFSEQVINHSTGLLKCSEGNLSSIMETGDFLSCRRIMSDKFYSIANYFRDTEEECVEKIKKYVIRSRSVPAYCIPCKNVNSCLGGMLCSRLRYDNKFNIEDNACHLLNKRVL